MYKIEDIINKIHCADCLQFMKGIPDKSIDLVLTSPPFKDEDIPGDYWNFYNNFFCEAQRIYSKVLIVIHSATKLNYLISNYPPHRLLIWGKAFSKYSYRFNPILVYQKSKDYNINKRIWSDCFAVPSLHRQMKEKKHKYQDPINLYLALFKMFKECNLILDPFLGSGTTAIACKLLNRNFIGIEINLDYCKIAQDRVDRTIYQPDLLEV